MKLTFAALALLALSGCAGQRTLYDWGGYSTGLYQTYKQPDTAGANLQKLQEHVSKLELGKAKVAPGMYADLGTMYLQAGKREQALENYRKERAAWPESAGLMDAMIKNLTSNQAVAEAKT